MARQIVWTKRANKKFSEIITYLEEEWGENVTKNFIRKTHDIIDLIGDQPEVGTLENPDKRIRGFRITNHNRLFYRLTEGQIILLNFFDTRQGPRKRKF